MWALGERGSLARGVDPTDKGIDPLGSLADRVYVREALVRTAVDLLGATSTDIYTPSSSTAAAAASRAASDLAYGAAAEDGSPESQLGWEDMASAGNSQSAPTLLLLLLLLPSNYYSYVHLPTTPTI
jgi:hypothetical protein